jgi:hypothetical protein
MNARVVFALIFLVAIARGLAAAQPRLEIYLRGLEQGRLYAGDPLRVAVALFPPAGEIESALATPDDVPWTAALRVRLHQLDGTAFGAPAWVGGAPAPSEIVFTTDAPALGVWRWPGSATTELPPGRYRVSARLVSPEPGEAPLAIAETNFELAAAPPSMTPAQRARWHHALALDAWLAGDAERARRLNVSSLSLEPAHAEAVRLKASLERPAMPAATASVASAVAEPPASPPAAPRPATPPAAKPPVAASAIVASTPSAPSPAVSAEAGIHWAASARASSEYGATDWGAVQAAGAPDSLRYGDNRKSWTPRTEKAGEEWLELAYATPVRATGVRVFQNFNPGALVKIELITEDGRAMTVWEGPDTTPYAKNQIGVFETTFPRTEKSVVRVKLTLDTKRIGGWKEIDAIALLAAP